MSVAANAVERISIDPRQLITDSNIRHDLRLDKDFVASVKDNGVLVPIGALRTETGELRVRYGHRRTQAAIDAGLDSVPVEIIGDESSGDAAQIDRIVTQHAENAHRAGLTSSEEIGVVEQLNAFGLSAAQIQKRIRIKRPAVDQALAASKSELAKQAADRYDFLTLAQASAVAEFEDDPEAVKTLVAAAKAGGFDHVVQQLRDGRADRQAQLLAESNLTSQNVTVVDRPAWTSEVTRLSRLHDGDQPLEEATHRDCPGHSAFLEQQWESNTAEGQEADEDDADAWTTVYTPVYVCIDPKQHGHVDSHSRRSNSTTPSPVDDEAKREERRTVLANNKAWRSAETVRRDWLRNFLSRKTAPKDGLNYVMGEIALGGFELRNAMESRHSFTAQLIGLDGGLDKAIEEATAQRKQVLAIAMVLGGCEAETGVHSWRSPNETTKRYLQTIEAWGYDLSAVEIIVAGGESD